MFARRRKGRMSKMLCYYLSAPLARRKSAAMFAAILQCPAFFSSCTEVSLQEGLFKDRKIIIQSRTQAPASFDLFIYNTDEAGNLDACQHIQASEEPVYALSGAGDKRIVALCESLSARVNWEQLRCYGNLSELTLKLEQDHPDHPLLSGEAFAADAASRQVSLSCSSSLSAIRIRSVSCDFSGRPYAGISLSCTRIFLLYAGAEYAPLGAGESLPLSYLNPGFLETEAIARMDVPEMVLQGGFGPVGKERVYPEQTLYCYPNPAQEAGLGTPVTALVLEMQADTSVCYYHIPLPGLEAGVTTVIDLSLLRLGSPDPDCPTLSSAIQVQFNRLPWEEREAYSERF